MQQIYQSYKGIFCEGYYVVSNEFLWRQQKTRRGGFWYFLGCFRAYIMGNSSGSARRITLISYVITPDTGTSAST